MTIVSASKGFDTGLYSVEVGLETAEERALDDDALTRALAPLLECRDIDPADVLFVHRCQPGPRGTWKRI